MIIPYLRPQDTITQILQQTPASAVSRRNPVVIGPQYTLFLTSATTTTRAFDAAGEGDLLYLRANGVVTNLASLTPDFATATLRGENLEAVVADFGSGAWTFSGDAGLRTIRIVTNTIAGDGTINAGLDGRQVSVGDVFSVTSTNNSVSSVIRRKVVSLVLKVGSTTEYDGVVFDGPIVNATNYAANPTTVLTSVDIFQPYTGVLDSSNVASGEALTATAAEWAYAAGLGIDETVTGLDSAGLAEFADGIGTIFISYRAVVIPSATEALVRITSFDDITEKLGETKLENWLARGALEAFKGNQQRVVYALRTGGDTAAHFATALKKIKTTDQVYALVGLTDQEDVMIAIKDHCELMSNKFNKNFRRAYVGTDSPGAYVHWGELEAGGYRTGDLAASILTLSDDFAVTDQFVAADVGATISVDGVDYEILEVLGDAEVLTDAPVGTSVTAGDLILTRPDTAENQAAFVIARSKALASRRIVNVWSDNPTRSDVEIPMKFVAAEIAGLRCALLPQQGMTMTEVLSIDAAASMYTLFEPALLDEVAANGTMIVSQDAEGGDVFIRHQLTTSTTEGALAYEDNVGVIVDDFSYAVKDEFREYIGRRNATPDTIREIDTKLRYLAAGYTRTTFLNSLIGPPVLAFFDENGNIGEVTVRQDSDLADTLMTYTKLRVPLPLNGLNHYVDVEVTEILAGADNVA